MKSILIVACVAGIVSAIAIYFVTESDKNSAAVCFGTGRRTLKETMFLYNAPAAIERVIV